MQTTKAKLLMPTVVQGSSSSRIPNDIKEKEPHNYFIFPFMGKKGRIQMGKDPFYSPVQKKNP